MLLINCVYDEASGSQPGLDERVPDPHTERV